MDDDQEVAAALAEVLRIDPSFAAAPDRLARALLDLLPHEPRTVRLLTLGAALGVPAAAPAAALDRLLADGGLRPEVAAWVLAHWRAAIADEPFGQPMEPPGPPTVVRLGVWPDGQVTTAVISATGISATDTALTARPGTPTVWRRIAAPTASTSRDAALVIRPESATILWSDTDGVHACDLTLGVPRLLVPCGQPRYPLAALATDHGSLDVLWTTDRETLRHSLVRVGIPAPEPTDQPFTGRPGERLKCLDVVQEHDHLAWLAVLTDQGRILVARWDLRIDSISAWTEIPAPTAVAAVSIVQLAGHPTVLACAPAGFLLSVDARQAIGGRVTWSSVDRPAGLPASGGAHALSAASCADVAWLAVCEQSGTWLARLALRAGTPVIGAPHRLRL